MYIALCSQHAGLEDIGDDGTWARGVEIREGGEVKTRKKGELVLSGRMGKWLGLRRTEPGLFEQGARVWGQQVGYEDSGICAWLSELLDEESNKRGCLLSVGMFSGELTAEVRRQNFPRNQIKHVIGNKQTARSQVTDI